MSLQQDGTISLLDPRLPSAVNELKAPGNKVKVKWLGSSDYLVASRVHSGFRSLLLWDPRNLDGPLSGTLDSFSLFLYFHHFHSQIPRLMMVTRIFPFITVMIWAYSSFATHIQLVTMNTCRPLLKEYFFLIPHNARSLKCLSLLLLEEPF